MSNTHPPEIDVQELATYVDDLDAAATTLREYGIDHDLPAIERNAKRVQGTVEIIRQNVPGGLTERN